MVVLRERAMTPAGDRALLVRVVAEATGVTPAEVEVSRRCARCGGDHGRPVLVHCGELGVDGIDLSLSRAGRSVAIAVSFAGPVGIDIESVAAASRAALDDVAFGPAERERLADADASPALRTAMWTAKEAVLKATGDGLRVDPRELEVSFAGRMRGAPRPALVGWPAAPVPIASFQLSALDAGPGLIGTIAVIADARPDIRQGR
ncbi:4'-phosphopantetheinyl transferase superfamily protein [Marisediminicola antarctica]